MNDLLDQLARDAGPTTNTVRLLAALGVVFVSGIAARLLGLLWPAIPPQERRMRMGSLATW